MYLINKVLKIIVFVHKFLNLNIIIRILITKGKNKERLHIIILKVIKN